MAGKVKRKVHVWVVEIKHHNEWLPCSGVGLTGDKCLEECAEWKKRNPDDKFRVSKYVREGW